MEVDGEGGRFVSRVLPANMVGGRGTYPLQDYWSDIAGKPNSGWICPTAPAGSYQRPEPDPNWPPSRGPRPGAWGTWMQGLGTNGTVHSAWYSGSQELRWTNLVVNTNIDLRVGSYGVNTWVGFDSRGNLAGAPFHAEAEIESPFETPVLSDATQRYISPLATDLPSENLFTGSELGIGAITVPRHGSSRRPVPTMWPASQKLPGAINVSFYDGHAEQVKLERLWNLTWHKGYVAPAKRPGL